MRLTFVVLCNQRTLLYIFTTFQNAITHDKENPHAPATIRIHGRCIEVDKISTHHKHTGYRC